MGISSIRSMYELNRSIHSELTEICRPLMDISGVTTLTYHRIQASGHAVSVCTNPDVLKEYLAYVEKHGMFFSQLLKEIPKREYYFYLWPQKICTDLHEILCQMDIWNGFNVYFKTDDYLENFVLTTHPDSNQVQNYCVNNLSTVKQFISLFKEKTKVVLDGISKEDMVLFNNASSWVNEVPLLIEQSQMCLKKIPFYIDDRVAYLSRREAQCLSLLGCGFTQKEIGRTLGLSPRTVETYIRSFQNKAGGASRLQILELLQSAENDFVRDYRFLAGKALFPEVWAP